MPSGHFKSDKRSWMTIWGLHAGRDRKWCAHKSSFRETPRIVDHILPCLCTKSLYASSSSIFYFVLKHSRCTDCRNKCCVERRPPISQFQFARTVSSVRKVLGSPFPTPYNRIKCIARELLVNGTHSVPLDSKRSQLDGLQQVMFSNRFDRDRFL